jgi:hypothetical protein
MTPLLRFFLPLGVLVALACAPTALAVHNADQHSSNMVKLFQSPNTSGAGGASATNSDIAFWGNRAFVGNYGGIRIYDISNPASPVLLSDFRCNGPQNDAAVWGNLLFTAIDATQGAGPAGQAPDQCGSVSVASATTRPAGWEGVRIFDVSNPSAPRQVGSVYTDCGAHTITVNPVSVGTIHLWVSSYPLAPGPTCGPVNGPPNGRHPHHGVIQVIEVPLNNPAAASEIAEPPINYPGDPDNAFNPAEHNLPLLTLRACHDIQIHVKLKIAAAACAEQGQLWRILPSGLPDTANPLWVVDEVVDSDGYGGGDVQVDFWHSATFSWDGEIVNFIDESFGSGCPTMTPVGLTPPKQNSDSGWMFFYDRQSGQKLSQMVSPRRTGTYCSAHLGNIAPVIGEYFLMNAWYTGGSDVVDFTNPTNPSEAAYYYTARVPPETPPPPPPPPATTPAANTWSHYWYETSAGDNNGFWTYGNDIPGGFQIFRVNMPALDIGLTRLNPQTQEDLFRCRLTMSPRSIRAGQSRTMTITAGLAPGVAITPGQRLSSMLIRLRGPGVRVSMTTNSRGVARVSGVSPTRRGTLRASLGSVPNLLGCSTSARVRPRPPAGGVRAGGAGGAGLTGRPIIR